MNRRTFCKALGLIPLAAALPDLASGEGLLTVWAKDPRPFRITFPDGTTWWFDGWVCNADTGEPATIPELIGKQEIAIRPVGPMTCTVETTPYALAPEPRPAEPICLFKDDEPIAEILEIKPPSLEHCDDYLVGLRREGSVTFTLNFNQP